MKPEILVSPELPPALRNLRPQDVIGKTGWAKLRKGVLRANQCAACGIDKEDTKRGKFEVHNVYKVSWDDRVAEFVGAVPLCRTCYNFTHLGKLIADYRRGTAPIGYLEYVIRHGFRVLGGLEPTSLQAVAYLMFIQGYSYEAATEYLREHNLIPGFKHPGWGDWRLKVGNEYHTAITQEDWREAYG